MTSPLNFASIQYKYSQIDLEEKIDEPLKKTTLSYQEVLIVKFGEAFFNKNLQRQFKAFEIFLQQRDLPKEEEENYFLFLNELLAEVYSEQETKELLNLFFSLILVHPQIRHFVHYFEERNLQKHVHMLAKSGEITLSTPKSRVDTNFLTIVPRSLYFLDVNGIKVAKYIKKNKRSTRVNRADKKVYKGLKAEIWSSRVSELLGNKVVPPITRFFKDESRIYLKSEGLLQKFFDPLNTFSDIYEKDKYSIRELYHLPSLSVQLYLLHEIIIGQGDAHGGNTAFTKDFDVFNIDNEMSFPLWNYETGKNNEGLGGGRIILMFLPQARVPLPKALLLFFSLPIVMERVLRIFTPEERAQNEQNYLATKERMEHLASLCRFALSNPEFELTCETIFFSLFTHEEFALINREGAIPELFIHYKIGITPPDTLLDWDNWVSPVIGIPRDYPMLHKEMYVGLTALQKVRDLYCPGIIKQKFKEVLAVQKNEINEDLIGLYDPKSTDQKLLPLFLKGTPRFSARRILREFPCFRIRLVNKKKRYSLQIAPTNAIVKIYQKVKNTDRITLNVKDLNRYDALHKIYPEVVVPKHIFHFSSLRIGLNIMWKWNTLRSTHFFKVQTHEKKCQLIFIRRKYR